MKVIALTLKYPDGVKRFNLADYPKLALSHKYCATHLSGYDPKTCLGSGWVYADGREVMVDGRFYAEGL